MTNQNKTPLHGGTMRVAFDGGDTVRRDLPFRAQSVNIDNLSPYWYKLNPIEEYIAPFQASVSYRLPLLTNFEFVCQSPPGIDQPVIVATTGIPGNQYPVIALFSSFDTNNDAGYSLLEQSANISQTVQSATGFGQVNLNSIDLTLYNGAYFLIENRSAETVIVTFTFLPAPTTPFTKYSLYPNEQVLFTIPKLGKLLRASVTSISGGALTFDYAFRPFLGYADYSAEVLSNPGATANFGYMQSIVGSGFVNINTDGIDNAYITVATRGVLFSVDRCWIKITASFANTATSSTLYSNSFVQAGGGVPFRFDLTNLLQREITSVTVTIVSSSAVITYDVSLHHISEPAYDSNYAKPAPYSQAIATTIPTGTNMIMALNNGGTLRALQLSILNTSAPIGSYLAIYYGSAIALTMPLAVVAANLMHSIVIDCFRPVPLETNFANIWAFTTAPAGVSIGLVAFLD